MKNKFSLSGFILKVTALITMTFDHIGVFMEGVRGLETLTTVFRGVGRLAFPIFIFLLVEGVRHTHHFGKYCLRLGCLALLIAIPEVIIFKFFDSTLDYESPILDLVVIALAIYLLNRKDKLSFLAILPIAYSIFIFVINSIEHNQHISIEFVPFFLRMDYTIFGMMLALGYYYSQDLAKLFFASNENLKYINTDEMLQTASNIISVLTLFVATFVFVLLSNKYAYGMEVQPYAAIAALPILSYSGARGYNSKWFQYGCYLYFPLHLVLIFLVFSII